ncbi:hypothetical protein V6N12_049620 [Hibiscus sabdariffa]|uniref:Uncharacterized protein n=1 Tax=Hibiscus sabdariffa TaxID=183260 RepID=A0ABR2GB57_9ROSI
MFSISLLALRAHLGQNTMAREMYEIPRQQIAQPANSCSKDGVVSFLDQVITPLYEVVAVKPTPRSKVPEAIAPIFNARVGSIDRNFR